MSARRLQSSRPRAPRPQTRTRAGSRPRGTQAAGARDRRRGATRWGRRWRAPSPAVRSCQRVRASLITRRMFRDRQRAAYHRLRRKRSSRTPENHRRISSCERSATTPTPANPNSSGPADLGGPPCVPSLISTHCGSMANRYCRHHRSLSYFAQSSCLRSDVQFTIIVPDQVCSTDSSKHGCLRMNSEDWRHLECFYIMTPPDRSSTILPLLRPRLFGTDRARQPDRPRPSVVQVAGNVARGLDLRSCHLAIGPLHRRHSPLIAARFADT